MQILTLEPRFSFITFQRLRWVVGFFVYVFTNPITILIKSCKTWSHFDPRQMAAKWSLIKEWELWFKSFLKNIVHRDAREQHKQHLCFYSEARMHLQGNTLQTLLEQSGVVGCSSMGRHSQLGACRNLPPLMPRQGQETNNAAKRKVSLPSLGV